MPKSFFLICGFAMLWALEQARNPALGRPRYEEFKEIVQEGCEIFLNAVLGAAFCFFILQAFSPRLHSKEMTGLALLAAYGLARLQKRSNLFFLTVAGFLFFMLVEGTLFSFESFRIAAVLAGGLSFFKIGMHGLRQRLLFSPVPRRLRGWPIQFFTAAIWALVLAAFRPLLR